MLSFFMSGYLVISPSINLLSQRLLPTKYLPSHRIVILKPRIQIPNNLLPLPSLSILLSILLLIIQFSRLTLHRPALYIPPILHNRTLSQPPQILQIPKIIPPKCPTSLQNRTPKRTKPPSHLTANPQHRLITSKSQIPP